MKNVIFIFLSFIAIYNLQAQSPNFEWVKSNQKIGWFGMTTATSTTLDTLGNVYLVGRFTGIVDFNPSPYYTTILTRDIDGYSSYIQKLDSNGNLIWVRALNFEAGGIGKIEIDKEGSLYIMGSFKDSVDIDPETNVHMLYSNGGYDAYILKISTNGNFIWAKSFGGIEDDVIRDIATDLQGNIYSHGSFKDTVDFDPGAGICIYGTNYSPPPSIHPLDNPFIQKLDKDGNFVWANTFICGEGSLSDGYSIDTDSDDNVYCAGYFFGSNIDFDPGAGVINPPSNNSSMYFVKLDSMGSFVWAKFSTKVGVSGHASPDAMVIDRFNNVFITGNSSLSIDFDPGLDTLLLSASTFIQKYNVNGDFLWAKSYGYGDIPHNITTDTFGNIYSIGSISDSTDLDPGPDTLMFYGNWAYLQKLNSNGDLLWGGALSGNIGGGGSSGYDIAVDIAGNIFAAGNYSGTIDFDPSLGVYNLMSINNFSASYILKLSQCKTLTTDYVTACDSLIWMDGVTYYESGQPAYFTLPSSTGCDSVICLSLDFPQINTTVDVSPSGEFSSMQNSAFYQWLDCNNGFTPLSGDTMQSYTPLVNGDYAVAINLSGCVDTSTCVHISNVSIDEIEGNIIKLFPNPNSGQFMLDLGNLQATEVKILNSMGQVIFIAQNPKDQYFNINLKSGIYFMEIRSGNGGKSIKFVVN